MASIFVSYKSEDHERARLIAQALQAEGFEVWYDHSLQAGEDYQEVIDRELKTALVVVVLWSKQSVKSRWVRSEATIGDRNGALAPAMVEPCDLPTAFVLVQTADLSAWTGDRDDPNWRDYISDIAAKAQRRKAEQSSGAAAALPDVELVYWQSIKDSTDVADLRSYLKRYPAGNFTTLARRRLAAMDRKPKGGLMLLATGVVAVAAIGTAAYVFRDSLMSAPAAPSEPSVVQPLAPAVSVEPEPDMEALAREMDAAWQTARKTNTAKAYQDFLEKYPTGPYGDAARAALASLTAVQSAPPPAQQPQTVQPAVTTTSTPPVDAAGPASGAWAIYVLCPNGARVQEADARFVNGQYSRRFGTEGAGGETFLRMTFATAQEVRVTGAIRFDKSSTLELDGVASGSSGAFTGTAKLGANPDCPFTATRKAG